MLEDTELTPTSGKQITLQMEDLLGAYYCVKEKNYLPPLHDNKSEEIDTRRLVIQIGSQRR